MVKNILLESFAKKIKDNVIFAYITENNNV